MAITRAHPAFAVDPPLPERWVRRLALAGALVCAGAVALATAGARGDAAFGRGLLELLVVGVPIAAGLYALRSPGNATFGVALLGIGFAWSLTALTESPVSVLYTIGRLSTWLTFPCVVYLLLAFPDGRIAHGLDRAILVALGVIFVVLFFGTAPLVAAFPPKTLWGTCTTDCPANALFVLDAQPAFLTQVIYVREWLVELLWLALFVSMYRRWRSASPLQRRAMGPAFVAGGALGLSHIAHITARQLGAPTDAVVALSSVWTFFIVAVCGGFVCGLMWRRMLLAQALARLGTAMRASEERVHTRDAVSVALRDATVELRFRDESSDTWSDARGSKAGWPPSVGDDRAVTLVGNREALPDVALIHDVALVDDRELLDGVASMVLAGWRHERLTADLSEAMTELDASRRRIAEAADLERVRIERDLHDGAQQRLVALRVQLGMVEDLLERDPPAGIQLVRELGFDAEAALDELRSLAHGVYPSLLVDGGIAEALRSMGRHVPLPVHVIAHGATRYPTKIESATYFACVEAVQNALKHASGASGVWITITQMPTELHFEVRDDGSGRPAGSCDGRGVRNMRDRIEAIGGTLAIAARRNRGTQVVGTIPLA